MVKYCLLLGGAVIRISSKSNPNDMETKRKLLASDNFFIFITSGIFASHKFVLKCLQFRCRYTIRFGSWIGQLFPFVLYFLYKLKNAAPGPNINHKMFS